MNRIIDYKIKGLSFEVRWELWKRLDNINRAMVKHLLEKPQGYTTFRSYGLTDQQIQAEVERYIERFKHVNSYMCENDRDPLFTNPEDTYASSCEYVDLLEHKKPEELVEMFGCSIEDYVPKTNQSDQ